jgi:hypothetical protein
MTPRHISQILPDVLATAAQAMNGRGSELQSPAATYPHGYGAPLSYFNSGESEEDMSNKKFIAEVTGEKIAPEVLMKILKRTESLPEKQHGFISYMKITVDVCGNAITAMAAFERISAAGRMLKDPKLKHWNHRTETYSLITEPIVIAAAKCALKARKKTKNKTEFYFDSEEFLSAVLLSSETDGGA